MVIQRYVLSRQRNGTYMVLSRPFVIFYSFPCLDMANESRTDECSGKIHTVTIVKENLFVCFDSLRPSQIYFIYAWVEPVLSKG